MGESPTASQFAEQVVAVLPQWTISHVGIPRVPWLSDRDAENAACPKCRRRLPYSFAQNSGGGLMGTVTITLSRGEHVAACLVDGPRSSHALPYTAHEIVEATGLIADRLHVQRWHGWSRLFRRALEGHLADDRDRIEAVGQALEALRVEWPFHYMTPSPDIDRGRELREPDELVRSALEVLVASSGPHWRVRASPRAEQ